MTLIPASFSCDICHKRRDEDVNHWLMLKTDKFGFEVQVWNLDSAFRDIHVCGESCLQKWIAGWFSERRNTPKLVPLETKDLSGGAATIHEGGGLRG